MNPENQPEKKLPTIEAQGDATPKEIENLKKIDPGAKLAKNFKNEVSVVKTPESSNANKEVSDVNKREISLNFSDNGVSVLTPEDQSAFKKLIDEVKSMDLRNLNLTATTNTDLVTKDKANNYLNTYKDVYDRTSKLFINSPVAQSLPTPESLKNIFDTNYANIDQNTQIEAGNAILGPLRALIGTVGIWNNLTEDQQNNLKINILSQQPSRSISFKANKEPITPTPQEPEKRQEDIDYGTIKFDQALFIVTFMNAIRNDVDIVNRSKKDISIDDKNYILNKVESYKSTLLLDGVEFYDNSKEHIEYKDQTKSNVSKLEKTNNPVKKITYKQATERLKQNQNKKLDKDGESNRQKLQHSLNILDGTIQTYLQAQKIL